MLMYLTSGIVRWIQFSVTQKQHIPINKYNEQ